MKIYQALYTYLSTESGVAAIAGTRGFPNVVPQDQNYPAWAYQQISGDDLMPHDGPTNFNFARYQITCVAESYIEAQDLALAIQVALDGFTGLMGGGSGVTIYYCHCDDITDGYNTGTQTHTTRLDAFLRFSE
jgi:hypothetical protein